MLIVMGISGIGVVLAVLQVTVPQLQPIPDPLNVTTDTFSRNASCNDRHRMMYCICYNCTMSSTINPVSHPGYIASSLHRACFQITAAAEHV